MVDPSRVVGGVHGPVVPPGCVLGGLGEPAGGKVLLLLPAPVRVALARHLPMMPKRLPRQCVTLRRVPCAESQATLSEGQVCSGYGGGREIRGFE